MSVVLKKYLNTTADEVNRRTFNIWMGLSLGNKYFTREHIREYLLWSLAHTKERVLIFICDRIHAYNIKALDGKSERASVKRAMKAGEEKAREVRGIIDGLNADEQRRISLLRWDDVSGGELYERALKAVREAYEQNFEFRKLIINIIKDARPDRADQFSRMSKERMDHLAEYVLHEIPILVNGVSDSEGRAYTLFPYPGTNALDDLSIGLNTGVVFPKLAKKLEIKNRIAIVDAWVEE